MLGLWRVAAITPAGEEVVYASWEQFWKVARGTRRVITESGSVVVKVYEGSQSEAQRCFQADLTAMAAQGLFPDSATWAPGEWRGGAFAVAVLLIFLFGFGLLILAYMLIVKPNRTLTVTYEPRATVAAEKPVLCGRRKSKPQHQCATIVGRV